MAAKKYPKGVKTPAQKAKFTRALKSELKKGRKESYARRVAKGIAAGKTRQQARGHKKAEHVERAKREAEEQGVTSAQLKSIRSFLERFNPHSYKDVPTEEDLVELVQDRDYATFQTYRKIWDAARRAYVRERDDGTYESRGFGYLVSLTTMATVRPQGEEPWLYYH